MVLSCWRAIGSPNINQCPTTLKAFDGHNFKPYRILISFPVELGGKTMFVNIEVVYAPLNYNLLLGRSWFYAMTMVTSLIFRLLQFPHQGQIVTIDQLDYYTHDLHGPNTNNVPFVEGSKLSYKHVGVGLLKDSSLMGTFPLSVPNPPQTTVVNMISCMAPHSFESSDPWVVPDPFELEFLGDAMPFSTAEVAYDAIQFVSVTLECDDVHLSSSYRLSLPNWLSSPPPSFDYFLKTFPSDESIMEVMNLEELPWKDHLHRSSFLPNLTTVETNIKSIVSPEDVENPQTPILTDDVLSEENLGNIILTMFIDIFEKPGVMENIQLGQTCSLAEIKAYTTFFKEFCNVFFWRYDEIPNIDPSIIVHEIKTYPDAKPVQQKLHPMYPRKTAAIKAKVEKLLRVGFIYPIPLIEWVSNIVPVMKKQGKICICIDYQDINHAWPKDNYPTPFIDQIIDNCVGSVIFSFMDSFLGYNQIDILPSDRHKTSFICQWGTFAYHKLSFGLKNCWGQRSINFVT